MAGECDGVTVAGKQSGKESFYGESFEYTTLYPDECVRRINIQQQSLEKGNSKSAAAQNLGAIAWRVIEDSSASFQVKFHLFSNS